MSRDLFYSKLSYYENVVNKKTRGVDTLTLIEYVRKEMQLSQVQLARELGISPTAVTQLEKGYRKSWPKLREGLSQFFGVDEGVLFDGDGWPKKINLDLSKDPIKTVIVSR